MQWIYTGFVYDLKEFWCIDLNIHTGIHEGLLKENDKWIWVVDYPGFPVEPLRMAQVEVKNAP